MSQGILEDEGDEASDQKKDPLKNRLENGGQQLELTTEISSHPVTSRPSTQDNYDNTLSGPDLTRHVFGSQCRSSREAIQQQSDARVDADGQLEDDPVSHSKFEFKPRDHESREEDEGGGDAQDSSNNQFNYSDEEMETERTVVEVTEEMLSRIENEQWEHVNGIYDENGEWQEWNETLVDTREAFSDDPLAILPYVDMTW